MIKKLNMGCGNSIKKGADWINADIRQFEGVNIVCDIHNTPFKDNEFDYIFSSHCLEHIDKPIEALKELHRITKNNGIIEIVVPYWYSETAFDSLDHKHFFSVKSLYHAFIPENIMDSSKHQPKEYFERKTLLGMLRCNSIFRSKFPFKSLLNLLGVKVYDEVVYRLRVIKNET
jgi:SAM-dependent methyltransferase